MELYLRFRVCCGSLRSGCLLGQSCSSLFSFKCISSVRTGLKDRYAARTGHKVSYHLRHSGLAINNVRQAIVSPVLHPLVQPHCLQCDQGHHDHDPLLHR
jgi:hypothetical protein